MSLTLYFHPLSSFCQKVLIALYENGTAFTPRIVDLGDPAQAAELKAMWPIGKFPLLHDSARDRVIPESSVIIEYLDQHYRGATPFIPAEPHLALEVRSRDRFHDLYVNEPMQKVVDDRLRPDGQKDPLGVKRARARLETAYEIIEAEMAARSWAAGEAFTLADCAAAPALFYADKVMPFGERRTNLAAYFDRLRQRPSYARVLKEAEPYLGLFPQ